MERLKKLCLYQPLIPIITVIALMSCFAILSATPMINLPGATTMWLKQGMFYCISAVIVFIIYKIGNEQIYDKIEIIYWLINILLLGLAIDHQIYIRTGIDILSPLVKSVNGATSWYNIKVMSLQPSEFMKIALVILLAKQTKQHNDYYLVRTLNTELKYIFNCLKATFIPAVLVLLQNDTGVVLIILIGVAFVIFGSGISDIWFKIAIVSAIAVVGIGIYLFIYEHDIFATIMSGHKLKRFYGWIDPEGTVGDEGFQLFYSLLSYGTAGWFGHGFQSVVMKFPEPQTDFIFAVITTNYGFIGGLITIVSIVVLDIIILKIGFDSTNDRDKYFVMGIIGMLLFQQIWNISMILGLLPITGITLPFFSYGGSSVLSYMIAIGMFIDINSQTNILKTRNY